LCDQYAGPPVRIAVRAPAGYGPCSPSKTSIFTGKWLALKLLVRQRNAGTRAGYRRDLNAFLDWCQQPLASIRR